MASSSIGNGGNDFNERTNMQMSMQMRWRIRSVQLFSRSLFREEGGSCYCPSTPPPVLLIVYSEEEEEEEEEEAEEEEEEEEERRMRRRGGKGGRWWRWRRREEKGGGGWKDEWKGEIKLFFSPYFWKEAGGAGRKSKWPKSWFNYIMI